MCSIFFFFNDTATTEIYTLSLHDALPIWFWQRWSETELRELIDYSRARHVGVWLWKHSRDIRDPAARYRSDRKSTRLNSSHGYISYAVFCLKKKQPPAEADAALRGRSSSP